MPCETLTDRLVVLAIGAVLGGLITFTVGRLAAIHTRSDKASERAASLCAHGLPLLKSLHDLNVAWKVANAHSADSARLFWSTYHFLVAPSSQKEFIGLCRQEGPFTHQVLTFVIDAADALERLGEKHESVRQLLSAPSKAAQERGEYAVAFDKALAAVAGALVQLSKLAPNDTKKAVSGHPAIGAHRGNA